MSEIIMAVDQLDAVRAAAFPTGFSTRLYEPGDAATWTRIHNETQYYGHVGPELYEREFGGDEAALQERQLFVINDGGIAVATATAWFNDPAHGVPGGRVHWVAVIPSLQRQGIASALLGAVCQRFRELGESTAYLTTDAGNSRAIALYTSLGFRIVGDAAPAPAG